MFSHRSEEPAVFTTLITEGNTSISLTAGHYLWVTRAHKKHTDIVRAGDVRVGDAVWVLQNANGLAAGLIAERVSSIAIKQMSGLYNPHTPSGCLIVDNMAALTFTETLPASQMWHSVLTMPARVLYMILPLEMAAWLNHVLLSAYFFAIPALPVSSLFMFAKA